MTVWSNFELGQYSLVIALYDKGRWQSFGPARPMSNEELYKAELILAFKLDGTTKVLKNRWGNAEGFKTSVC